MATFTVESLLNAALTLPVEQRAELAEKLRRSLAEQELSPAEQAEVDAAWSEEIRRRIREADEGKAELVPGEEVLAKLRARRKV